MSVLLRCVRHMKATVSWSKRCFQQPTKQFLSSTTSSTSTGKLELTPLTAVSPIDGRYAEQTSQLRHHFSEYALIQQRVTVEVEWLKYLADRSVVDLKPDAHKALSMLDVLVTQFSLDDAARVKELESTTKHDVKAVEYFIKERISNSSLANLNEFVHFACTSEDINNLAYGCLVRNARLAVVLPVMDSVVRLLRQASVGYADVAMLSRTHGQPATPTTLGKELANFVHRLEHHRNVFANLPVRGKFNGAVGNFNAHMLAYEHIDWPELCKGFVEHLGMVWNPYTTQIEPHDYMAEMLDAVCRWSYISIGYFKQRTISHETGSSTMPHKVNPIHFENAEGNLGLANAAMQHLVAKLPVSRFQRDLSDSTVLRSIGVGFAHSIIAYQAIMQGMARVDVNLCRISDDLNDNWEVLGEPIQTVMRKYKVPNAYERLKDLTRGRRMDADSMQEFLETLRREGCVPACEVDRLQALTPATYVGNAADMARRV